MSAPSLDGHLDVDVDDDAVELTFTVQNADTEPVDLEFRSGQVADFVVDEGGAEVWRWSEGQLFTQMLQTRTLDSGEALVETVSWPDPDPGRYRVLAHLVATNADVEARADFEV